MTTKPTTLFCDKLKNHKGENWFAHFYPSRMQVRMCRLPEEMSRPMLEVEVSERTEAPGCYWAWWDEEHQRFDFVYPHKGLVEICFPYGTKVEEGQGRGKLLPVNVKVMRETEPR